MDKQGKHRNWTRMQSYWSYWGINEMRHNLYQDSALYRGHRKMLCDYCRLETVEMHWNEERAQHCHDPVFVLKIALLLPDESMIALKRFQFDMASDDQADNVKLGKPLPIGQLAGTAIPMFMNVMYENTVPMCPSTQYLIFLKLVKPLSLSVIRIYQPTITCCCLNSSHGKRVGNFIVLLPFLLLCVLCAK